MTDPIVRCPECQSEVKVLYRKITKAPPQPTITCPKCRTRVYSATEINKLLTAAREGSEL